jgi:hypothetical protein
MKKIFALIILLVLLVVNVNAQPSGANITYNVSETKTPAPAQ